ncbi:TetR family transcriptional regulator [Adlercreutzia equolifaciens]|uniref:TetR/AcrR family transcriptional regulator n=1 Tax=Adlercreutzia equolifaciens TaxID=446660 RepID=UPI0023AEF1BC|nr:TetR family transcriptional regulator [Adlercreutzia equolifaciens]MDE8701475.1 TetR family transcriptional regulator [Adlercreutzia equolifaciens]
MNAPKRLIAAFLKLTEDRTVEDVTILDLCNQADISKQTFYRYFTDKYALMEECYERELYRLFSDKNTSWDEKLTKYFGLLRRFGQSIPSGRSFARSVAMEECNVKLYRDVLNAHLAAQGADIEGDAIKFAVDREARSAIAMVREWACGGMQETDSFMSEHIMNTMPSNIASFFTQNNR